MTVLDQLAPQILFVGAGIFSALVLASCIIFSLVKVYPNTNYSELVSRIKSWWVMASIFLVVLVIGPMGSIIFYGVLSFLALKEFLTLIPTRISDRHTLFWAYIAIPIQYYWISLKWYPMFLIFIPVYAFLFLPFRMLLSKETKGFLGSISSIHWGLMTMVFCLSHQVYLLALPNEVNPNGGDLKFDAIPILRKLKDARKYAQQSSAHYGTIKKTR